MCVKCINYNGPEPNELQKNSSSPMFSVAFVAFQIVGLVVVVQLHLLASFLLNERILCAK